MTQKKTLDEVGGLLALARSESSFESLGLQKQKRTSAIGVENRLDQHECQTKQHASCQLRKHILLACTCNAWSQQWNAELCYIHQREAQNTCGVGNR